ncbi:LacI family DNA-binding transcriptional regulator [Gangjinia marincola]|uniref:LacI family DNA-binding transcriptional regulator n=1 Tax=Gangjinia marincola TaxID=578463 RepID=A0ABN1MI63_9FLAO
MPSVTLKEIAETLGISIATVSKALKGYPDISESTKQRVQELAKSLNYHPNSFAQSLRTQQSNLIGLIIPEIVHHFFANIIQGVIDEAKKEGYLVIVLQSDESYIHEKEQLQLLLEKNVDGILISLSDKTVHYKHVKEVIDAGMPVVLYDKISKSLDCSKIIIDDRGAAKDATTHLILRGCQKIAHISGPLKPQTTIDRYLGYKDALKEHGISFQKELVYTSENLSYEDGYALGEQILIDHPDVDGIFSFTDLVATGALTKIREMGIKIPDQVSIMGFSNWFLARITTPTLSTVDQPGYRMGQEAFKQLCKEIKMTKDQEIILPEIIKIPTKIVQRQSTR